MTSDEKMQIERMIEKAKQIGRMEALLELRLDSLDAVNIPSVSMPQPEQEAQMYFKTIVHPVIEKFKAYLKFNEAANDAALLSFAYPNYPLITFGDLRKLVECAEGKK